MAEKRQGRAEGTAPQKSVFATAPHQVERAAGEFRRGVPIVIRAGDGRALAFAAETVSDAALSAAAAAGFQFLMLLTPSRAETLKIPLYTPDVVAIRLERGVSAKRIIAIADPATDLAEPLKGPFDPIRGELPAGAVAAIRLAKLSGLLPAVIAAPIDNPPPEGLVEIDAEAISDFESAASRALRIVARARLPLRDAETCEMVSFRPADGGAEHHAVIVGEMGSPALATPGPVLARLHSECFTGDLLGSLRCDCGDQLRGAIRALAEAGGGVLLYLAQEGRGIGLMNKLRAYALQDQGFDTIDANVRLGFEADERLYDTASRMLTLLGYDSVRLMTNNPDKIRALELSGIRVTERVAHRFPENVHNRDYLETKAKRSGHLP